MLDAIIEAAMRWYAWKMDPKRFRGELSKGFTSYEQDLCEAIEDLSAADADGGSPR